MGDERRRHDVMVRLNDAELARLDEIRPPGIVRAVFLRGFLREPPTERDVADRTEALAILSQLARAGKVTAAIALERALRHEDQGDIDNELARLLSD